MSEREIERGGGGREREGGREGERAKFISLKIRAQQIQKGNHKKYIIRLNMNLRWRRRARGKTQVGLIVVNEPHVRSSEGE